MRANSVPAAETLTQFLPRHGAHARHACDRIEGRWGREIDSIALETGATLLLGAGPALIPRDINAMGDLVTVDRVGAAVAGHAAKQGFHLRGCRLRPCGLAAVARHGEDQHASVGA